LFNWPSYDVVKESPEAIVRIPLIVHLPRDERAGSRVTATAMPVGGLNRWYPRDVYDKVEMGRYFTHPYNLPLYKIPVNGSAPRAHDGEPSYTGRHMLFDIVADQLQQSPLNDAATEVHFVERIVTHLRACEAPAEQYERLGIPHAMS
jgi:hypothetical protein